ncbi:MAG TPA: hypothetical protein VN806_04965 [Caulobacteraceae bacterium]|nr:hypothetical protein [Caulobacteraceae bacterium]
MRVPILSAFVAAAALFALPAAAHGWVDDRDDTVVEVRECPLPAPPVAHRHVSHVVYRHRHVAVRCQVAEAPPVDEHVVRIFHHEDRDACADRDRCGDRDRDDGWRDHDWRGADRDRDMYEDHGMAMRHDDGDHDRYGDHDMVVRHDDGERRMWDDHARAYVDGSVHHEDEDRRGWDDHEYAQRGDGMHWDHGDVRAHAYYEERERTFERGEHWIEHCGCGPARPTATDEDGYLVWAGKVAPDDEDGASWEVHP